MSRILKGFSFYALHYNPPRLSDLSLDHSKSLLAQLFIICGHLGGEMEINSRAPKQGYWPCLGWSLSEWEQDLRWTHIPVTEGFCFMTAAECSDLGPVIC